MAASIPSHKGGKPPFFLNVAFFFELVYFLKKEGITMFQQVLVSAKKEFWDSFIVPLAHYPVACRVTNVTLFGELLPDNTILVFGRYEFLFCHYKEENQFTPGYHAAVMPRTFCERIQPVGSWAAGALPGDVELQVSFSRPLRVHTRPGKPARLNLGDFWKSIFSYPAWVEVQVDGEITAEIALVPKSLPDLPRTVVSRLAGAEKNEGKEPVPPQGMEKPGGLTEQEAPARGPAAETKPLTIDLEQLADLVMKILRQREQANVTGQEISRQEPNKAGSQVVKPAPAVVTVADPPLPSLPLEQIPSRPGLYKTFQPYVPPPKPPGKGG
ncbi:hypothetical protein [Desulfofundulus thermocisternus]|uniref:hypothetical protein n=1 Tax=Desulfofundulus thermocisternus TaxID=42471 RepID=UPI00048872DC|nr:hypothetical protein [Desulfofundulus thermocisternus]